jgi:5-methylcytosine-specific restriction protein A
LPAKPKVYRPAKFGKDIRPKDVSWGKGRGGRPWQRKRNNVLRRDSYECQSCLREFGRHVWADEVDHIIALSEGGTDDESNLEGICIPHHKKKTAEESKRALTRSRSSSKLANLIA